MATIPQPLWYRGDDNLQIMTSTDIADVINQAISVYAANPSVTLAPSGTTDGIDDLGPITNTFLIPGATSTSTTAFPTEATTQEPQLVSTDYYIAKTISDSAQPVDPLPLYRNADGTLQSMTINDFLDTFIKPAIDNILDSTNYGTTLQGGAYSISTVDSVYQNTLIGTAFIDTIYGEATTTYYLQKQNGPDATPETSSVKCGAFRRSDGNIQAYSLAGWNHLLQKWMRYTAASTAGYKIEYSLDSGSIMGSGMTDTRLTGGSGTYVTQFVNDNDYRAFEIPDGTPTVISTKYLRMYRA